MLAIAVAVAADVGRAALDASTHRSTAAVLDSAFHGGIAGAVWLAAIFLRAPGAGLADKATACLTGLLRSRLAALHSPWSLTTAMVCAALSTALDADHLAAAGSLSLTRALSLSSRPWGHSVPFALAGVLLAHALGRRGVLPHAAVLVACAWGTHQLRDAVRRGLWCPPLGSTPTLPYALYLALIGGAPLLVAGSPWGGGEPSLLPL